MKTKKIVADSMPLALKKVRQELGENAVIVNTRAVKKGGLFGLFGKQKYEVTAYAMDSAPGKSRVGGMDAQPTVDLINRSRMMPPSSGAGQTQSGQQAGPLGLAGTRSGGNGTHSGGVNHATPSAGRASLDTVSSASNEDKLLDELHHMRKMMMTMMLGDKSGKTFPPALAKSMVHLKRQGVADTVREAIMDELVKKHASLADLDESTIKQEISIIVERIIESRVPKQYAIDERIRLINVIGPTGVGKTTSIAKLATEQVLKQKRKVGMITTDVYRIAAVEQLKTYAGILNVPIEVVHSADELEGALRKLKHCDLIYMDTTGRNYKEAKYRESIQAFLNHPSESENYLVLSFTSKFEDQQILLQEFANSSIRNLILTKFDETSSYGAILNIAYEFPYQLVYITNGQSVPEDITRVDAKRMTKYLLGDETDNGSSTESSRIHASI